MLMTASCTLVEVVNKLHLFRTYVTNQTKVFQKTAEGGANTSLHCAFAECVAEETGKYYKDCAVVAAAP